MVECRGRISLFCNAVHVNMVKTVYKAKAAWKLDLGDVCEECRSCFPVAPFAWHDKNMEELSACEKASELGGKGAGHKKPWTQQKVLVWRKAVTTGHWQEDSQQSSRTLEQVEETFRHITSAVRIQRSSAQTVHTEQKQEGILKQ
ncbi:hypothetical protein NDU88_000002 [Pleurodeles waltl]|uniref:Uncharacterized protein n=1 Tax=Pleurodeles waltl TaxID=8319 RepID=A0AAV7KNT4_PLEWA|nr:hypothetical protein NDU88_000002 [Pleurodeles waltl]